MNASVPEQLIVTPTRRTPGSRERLLIAVLVGTASGLFAAFQEAQAIASTGHGADVGYWWRAAQLWVGGESPYRGIPDTPDWPFSDYFYYPMPAVLVSWPVQALSLPAATGVQLGVSAALLTWALTASGWWRLWLLASPGLILALELGQWSPLLTAAALLPALGWACAIKPSLGLAHLAYRLDWRAFALAGAFLVLSVPFYPPWPAEWLRNLAHLVSHPAPIATPVGALVALAVLRWRQREARFLFALACVPQLLFFADQLGLGLVARTRPELVRLMACQWIGAALWFVLLRGEDVYVLTAAPYVLLAAYLPALATVLWRPNEGPAPAWLERALERLRIPATLRGRAQLPTPR